MDGEQEDHDPLREARDRIRQQLQQQPRTRLRERAEPEGALAPVDEERVESERIGELETLAQRPRLDGTDHLQAANAGAVITGPVQLVSQVPVLGPLLTLLRRLARPFVKPLLDPYLDRQERFNAHVVRHLNELGNRLELRLARIEDPERVDRRVELALRRYDEALKGRHTLLFDALEEEIAALQNLTTDRSAEATARADAAAARVDELAGRLGDFDQRFTRRALAVDARFEEKDAYLQRVLQEKDGAIGAKQDSIEKALVERDAALAAALALRDEQLGVLHKRVDAADEHVLDEAELLSTRAALSRTLAELGRSPAQVDVRAEVETWSRLRDWMSDTDYQSFQDRFRGDPTAIAERMHAHVERFASVPGPVADLGCGRGEFLLLLRDAGIEGIGVETNIADVESCQQQGLSAVHADLFDWLADREPESLGGVFMAQVIEHLQPRDWARVIELASTRIAPGGVLLIETVNPVSLYAFARAYVIDPTHTRPVHPHLVAYLAERQGFWPVEIAYQAPVPPQHRVQPLAAEEVGEDPRLRTLVATLNERLERLDELCFAPQEYALVANKPARD